VEGVLAPVFIGPGLKFAEGSNFDRDGTLYCVDVFGGGIGRKPPGGALREWVNTGGGPMRPTNVAFWQESLYVTEGNSGSIYRLDIGVREQSPFMRPWRPW
jgi:sugar lactone lactonase YvrE